MKLTQKAAILYLCFCLGFCLGMLAGHYRLVESIWDFVGYSNGVPVTVADKLANDFGGTPFRFLYKYAPATAPDWKLQKSQAPTREDPNH